MRSRREESTTHIGRSHADLGLSTDFIIVVLDLCSLYEARVSMRCPPKLNDEAHLEQFLQVLLLLLTLSDNRAGDLRSYKCYRSYLQHRVKEAHL